MGVGPQKLMLDHPLGGSRVPGGEGFDHLWPSITCSFNNWDGNVTPLKTHLVLLSLPSVEERENRFSGKIDVRKAPVIYASLYLPLGSMSSHNDSDLRA